MPSQTDLSSNDRGLELSSLWKNKKLSVTLSKLRKFAHDSVGGRHRKIGKVFESGFPKGGYFKNRSRFNEGEKLDALGNIEN